MDVKPIECVSSILSFLDYQLRKSPEKAVQQVDKFI